MKKRILILMVLCFALAGCSLPQQPQTAFAPERDSCLTVYTTMDKTLWEPFLLEFQERSGIWVRLEQMDHLQLLEKMEQEPENMDLLLGCSTDTMVSLGEKLAPLPAAIGEKSCWTPVFYQIPVIIYNPHLIQKNLPAGFLDLLAPRWQGSFAISNPNTDAVSRIVLTRLWQLRPEEEIRNTLSLFSRNVGRIFQNTGEVLDAVEDGTCPLGIVPESAALTAVTRGEKLAIVYPREGALLTSAAMAMPRKSTHGSQAEKLMKFLLDPRTQQHGWEFCSLRPVMNRPEYLPQHPVYEDPDVLPASWQKLMPVWNELREGAK